MSFDDIYARVDELVAECAHIDTDENCARWAMEEQGKTISYRLVELPEGIFIIRWCGRSGAGYETFFGPVARGGFARTIFELQKRDHMMRAVIASLTSALATERAGREQLRAALKPFVDEGEPDGKCPHCPGHTRHESWCPHAIAQAALAAAPPPPDAPMPQPHGSTPHPQSSGGAYEGEALAPPAWVVPQTGQMAALLGAWPGDESDAELLAGLAALDAPPVAADARDAEIGALKERITALETVVEAARQYVDPQVYGRREYLVDCVARLDGPREAVPISTFIGAPPDRPADAPEV